MPVFHQGVGHEDQPGFLAFTLAQQPGLRVRCALMGGIAAPFPMKVNRWVARVSIGCPGRVAVPGFEALQAGCRLNQGSVHREVLVRQQALPVRFQHHLAEQSLANSMLRSSRSRFLVKVVASKLGSIRFISRNHRKRRL